MFPRSSIRLLALAIVAAFDVAWAAEEARTFAAKELSSSTAWKLDQTSSASLLEWPGVAAAAVKLTPGGVTELLLKEPLAIPPWADGLTFTLGTGDWTGDGGFRLRLLITDSRGAEYAYKATSPLVSSRENYFYPSHPVTWSPLRLTVPGLRKPKLGAGEDERDYSIEVRRKPSAGSDEPQGPLTLRGLEITGIKPGLTKIHLQDFVFSRVSPRTSKLHYLINQHERFGEVDGLPWLSLGMFGPSYGESYRLVWTVRDRYDGRPFLSGEKSFAVGKEPRRIASFAERIEFPITEKGVYWITVRRLWNNRAEDDIPEQIDTFTYRLDILDGQPGVTRKPLAGPIPGLAVTIGETRDSSIFAANEPRRIDTTFRPAARWKAPSYRITATQAATGKLLQTWEGALTPGGGPQTVSTDLGALGPGAVQLQAELREAGRPVDRDERLLGFPEPASTAETAPDPAADWHKLADRQSLIYVGMSKGPLTDPAERLAKVKSLLDEAGTISRLVEYEFPWSGVEPLPGVWDWSEVDAVVDYARSKGQTVLLWPSFIGSEPDWIPPHFQFQADGSVSGTRSYLFQGGRINFWHARDLKENILRLCRAMALRYRSHPGVHGYYLIVEHGGDNPWFQFFPGYEPETQADYRDHLRKKYPTVEALGAAWGRSVPDWKDISVPAREASDRERLDWNQFRRNRLGEFFVEAVREIRSLDPHKLVMVYTGAADGDFAAELAGLGCILADGGAASPIEGGPTTMGYAAAGLGRRTEEISVSQWAAQFPTQLDATLFNLTLGGGRNANAKMFFLPGKPLAELRKDPRIALDRFEKFLPIWKELAPTEVPPWEAFLLKDEAGSMMLTKSTSGFEDAYMNMSLFDAHILAPAVPMPLARQGKFLVLQPRVLSYEAGTYDQLDAYVRDGGHLVLWVNSGRLSPDLPGEDFILLRRLGIVPTAPEPLRAGTLTASPAPGAGFDSQAGTFKLRDAWKAPVPDARVLATFDAENAPAITRHQVGKGVVDVIWAESNPPPTEGGGYPFLRDLADAAGVTRHSDASVPSLWTNLLRHPGTGDHYGTVYHAALTKTKGPAVAGTTFWQVPPGRYAITELITGRSLGVQSAEALAGTGLETSLGPREVAVFRFQKQP